MRGLERLKRAPDLDAATVDRTRVLFEGERADMNTHFCNNIEGTERSDASNFDKRVREFEKEPSVESRKSAVLLGSNVAWHCHSSVTRIRAGRSKV